jgi:glucose/arabinose dehydrogenase
MRIIAALLLVVALPACEQPSPPATPLQCDPSNDGLRLPAGFCAAVVTDNLGNARNLTVRDNGDIYVVTRNWRLGLGSLMALRDSDGDGSADIIETFSDQGGVDLTMHLGQLYVGHDDGIYRYRLAAGKLLPEQPPELIAGGFPEQERHLGKGFAIDPHNNLYVNVGAPSNACQEQDREVESPGRNPCPELERHAGIWRFDANTPGQTQIDDGYVYARGIRNAYALAWSTAADALFAVQHGRDELHQLWPAVISVEQDAELPAEEFIRVEEGATYAWPYCYFDQRRRAMVLSPEYGGDGNRIDECGQYPTPLMGFPGHYSPNDLLFYEAEQFPSRYRNGAFIAFHGSYNRAPEQVGYQVIFVPFVAGHPAGEWEVFADGFAGPTPVNQPEDALHRPTGLAVGPDGSLYVADSVTGRIWRIRYVGE